jgi:hypothetical protein
MTRPATFALVLLLAAAPCSAAEHFVSPAGAPGGDGSEFNVFVVLPGE